MTTTIDNKAGVYSRPAAQFDGDGNLEVRASASGNCRRALWYAATGHEITNPTTDESLTVMEAGNALEPVVLRAMERAGWEVTPADSRNPNMVSVQVGPNLTVSGHPDATGVLPLFGGEAVIEVKTRGPEAFKRWRTLGAERSHPSSVAQAAFYTLGIFGETRDAVIATMDTGSRAWDYEVIPAARLGQALERASEWLGQLGAHHALNGPDPGSLPERDFSAVDWQCKSCPFLNVCLPAMAAEAGAGRGTRRRAAGGAGDRRGGAGGAPGVRGDPGEHQGVRGREAVGDGQAPGLAGPEGGGQGQARRAGEDPLRGHGEVPALLGGLQEAQYPARPGEQGGSRHRERHRVPAGELDAP